MVGMSELGSVLCFVLPMVLPTDACEDNPTIVEVDENLFWLKISVQAFLGHSFSHGD